MSCRALGWGQTASWGADRSSSCTWEPGTAMLSEKQLGTPWVAPVSWLSAPYKAVGLWPYSFLPSSCGWKLLPPALTKAPLTLSPSDFPSRGFEELGCAGGGKGGTGRINSFLLVEEYPQTPFLMKRAVSCSPGQMLAGHLFGKRFRN